MADGTPERSRSSRQPLWIRPPTASDKRADAADEEQYAEAERTQHHGAKLVGDARLVTAQDHRAEEADERDRQRQDAKQQQHDPTL